MTTFKKCDLPCNKLILYWPLCSKSEEVPLCEEDKNRVQRQHTSSNFVVLQFMYCRTLKNPEPFYLLILITECVIHLWEGRKVRLHKVPRIRNYHSWSAAACPVATSSFISVFRSLPTSLCSILPS